MKQLMLIRKPVGYDSLVPFMTTLEQSRVNGSGKVTDIMFSPADVGWTEMPLRFEYIKSLPLDTSIRFFAPLAVG